MNNDVELFKALGDLDRNTLNAWRHRHAIPEDKLAILRGLAVRFAKDDDEREGLETVRLAEELLGRLRGAPQRRKVR
jgi:hypothetical protein